MENLMQKYVYIYMIQWIFATLYARGMCSTLGENTVCTAISILVLGLSRVCLCQPIESVGPC